MAAITDRERIAKLEERTENLATTSDLNAAISALEARLTWKLLLWTGIWTGLLVGIVKFT